MTTVSRPIVNANLSGASLPVPNSAQKVLIVGQMTSAGTATSGELNTGVEDNTEGTLFGAPSQLANAIEAYKVVNDVNPIDAIALDDPAGTAATGTIAFTAAAATEAGSLTVTLAEQRNGVFTLPIAVGDDEDTICAALVALIQANAKCLMSAAVDGVNSNECDLTAKNVGTIGNSYGIKVTGTVGGVTYAITGMSGGVGVPALTNLFDVIGSTRYQTIIWPAEYGTSTVKTLLDARFNVVNNIQDGVAIMVAVDTKSNLATLGDANNSQSIVIFGEKPESTSKYKGPTTLESPLSEAALFGAVRALRLSEGADISDYSVGSGGALDNTGGPAIASMPYFDTPLPLPVHDIGSGWTDTEVGELNDAGISVLGSNTAGNAMILADVLTTYKTDSAGNPDDSWKYLNYVDTGSQSREYQFNNIKSDAAQHRATDGNLKNGRKMHNVSSITNLMISYFGVLSSADYVLLRDGEENLTFYKDNLTVTLNLLSGLFTVTEKLPIVTQTRQINLSMSLTFSV